MVQVAYIEKVSNVCLFLKLIHNYLTLVAYEDEDTDFYASLTFNERQIFCVFRITSPFGNLRFLADYIL